MKYLLAVCITLFAFAVRAQTQSDMNSDADNNFKKVDQELNRVYTEILHDYADDTLFIRRFKESERAWLAYRDAEMVAIFPHLDSAQSEYGTVFPMCWSSWLAELEGQRLKQLKVWYDGMEEGDVCSGSIHTTFEQKQIHAVKRKTKEQHQK